MKFLKTLLFLLLVCFFSDLAFSENLKKPEQSILGIYIPFAYSDDVKVLDCVKNEIDLPKIIPQLYLKTIKSEAIFKDVVEVNETGANSDYLLKGIIQEVYNGNPGARYRGDIQGYPYIKMKFIFQNNAGNVIYEKDIFQRAPSGILKRGMFGGSNKMHILNAADESKSQAVQFVKEAFCPPKPIVKIDEKAIKNMSSETIDILSMINSGDYLKIRDGAKSIASRNLYQDKALQQAIMNVIINYTSNPDKDEFAVDAVSWCCNIASNSENVEFISILEKLCSVKIAKKVKKYAEKALAALKN